MSTQRMYFTATVLGNGKVLVAGGLTAASDPYSPATASADIFDPSTGRFTATASMGVARAWHTATLLPNGKVLVAGGASVLATNGMNSAEIYDPTTGRWAPVSPMLSGRTGQAGVLLKNGKVLAVGGGKQTPFFGAGTSGAPTIAPEIYDPATDKWSTVASQGWDRQLSPTATLLPDGRVLLVGGRGNDTLERSEVYDPASNTWTPVPTDPRFTARQYSTATLLPNGQVLVAGGLNANSPTAAASIYNPVINNWQIGPNMNQTRCGQGAALLSGTKVLVAGSGCDFRSYSAGAEEFDSASNQWARVASLNAPLGGIAVALGGGRVLFIGETVVTFPGDVEMFVPA